MINYKHLLAFDLSSYGCGMAIINQFCDNEDVKIFEMSPIGTHAILILLVKDLVAAQVLIDQVISIFKNSILSSALIENYQNQLLQTYLSQQVSQINKHLAIFEFGSVSEALMKTHELLNNNIHVADLRIIRSLPMNVIATSTSDNLEALSSFSENNTKNIKVTLIPNVSETLKSYFIF